MEQKIITVKYFINVLYMFRACKKSREHHSLWTYGFKR